MRYTLKNIDSIVSCQRDISAHFEYSARLSTMFRYYRQHKMHKSMEECHPYFYTPILPYCREFLHKNSSQGCVRELQAEILDVRECGVPEFRDQKTLRQKVITILPSSIQNPVSSIQKSLQ